MNKFWKEYPQIEAELMTVNTIIKSNIKCREPFFETTIGNLVDSGGKMLRPAFLLLSAKFGEYNAAKSQTLAAAVEMLHMATLVHDDVIDNSKLRRGYETIQHKYGKEYAVYTGDFLFSQCLMLLSEHDYTMDNMQKIAKAMSKICMGEVTQYHLRYASNTNVRNYLRVASGKTAALFAMSFYAGSKESGCSEQLAKTLAKIGYNIGMAFQIVDDLLDYKGDASTVGKSVQSDLKEGYYTLPLIFAMQNEKDDKIKEKLKQENLTEDDIKQIMEWVVKNKGIEKAKKMANRYTQKAFDQINKLPECESKTIIHKVVEGLLIRDY